MVRDILDLQALQKVLRLRMTDLMSTSIYLLLNGGRIMWITSLIAHYIRELLRTI